MQLILILLFFFINLQSVLAGLRIIGGREVYEDEFPYVLGMRHQTKDKNERGSTSTNYEFICSSSLLSNTWCLTAAHCIPILRNYISESTYNYPQIENKGVVTSPDLKKISEVLQSIIHPSYKEIPALEKTIYPNNDIALLRCEPMVLTRYAKLSALDFTTLPGHEVLVVGYGMNEAGVTDFNETLRVYKGLLISCPYDSDDESRPRGLCESHACGTYASSCEGDSGGPILHVSGLVAVTSFGADNCNVSRTSKMSGNFLTQTVPVSPYINWITGLMTSRH